MKPKVKKQLSKTRSKVSTNWKKYQKEKQRILNMRLSYSIKQKKIENLLSKTRSKNSNTWEGYRDKKYILTHESGFNGLTLKKRKKHKSSDEQFLNFTKKANKEKVFDQIKKESKAKYILVVLKIQMNETEEIHHISDSFSMLAFKRTPSNEIIDLVIEKFNVRKRYEGFTLLDVSIRLIYEGIKKTKRK